ncbi:MAG: DnaA regulatory inactivator Hda [Woeseiaceae bacterium]|nr:DnaA regulatory inactivator Hda [Woeseiaceae bacterium]
MSQMALPLKLADHAVFDSFVATGNEELVAALVDIASGVDGSAFIWGGPSTGKTHLLQAICAHVGDRSVYVPFATLAGAGPGVIEGLASRDVVCLDDLEFVAGNPDWELGLFSLYNDLVANGGSIVIAASMPPREAPIALADLQSRLSQLPTWRLRVLEEQERLTALKLRAAHRGLELPDETARYLLSRSRRDMASLYAMLDTLDGEALRAQRRLTVPFVSDVLKGMSADD